MLLIKGDVSIFPDKIIATTLRRHFAFSKVTRKSIFPGFFEKIGNPRIDNTVTINCDSALTAQWCKWRSVTDLKLSRLVSSKFKVSLCSVQSLEHHSVLVFDRSRFREMYFVELIQTQTKNQISKRKKIRKDSEVRSKGAHPL